MADCGEEVGRRVIRVCFHGAESTGKSYLARKLEAEQGIPWVPEYGRDYAEVHGTQFSMADLLTGRVSPPVPRRRPGRMVRSVPGQVTSIAAEAGRSPSSRAEEARLLSRCNGGDPAEARRCRLCER